MPPKVAYNFFSLTNSTAQPLVLSFTTVDIWDGDDGPAIFHGRTLTTKVSLQDVVRAIARYAFVASPYPVVISAEIHCCLEQQDMAAEIMRKEFGSVLVDAPIHGEEKGSFSVLPSPEELKGRILFKVSLALCLPFFFFFFMITRSETLN